MIEIINLKKFYKVRYGYINILNGISLTITSGMKVGILGRNGSGKSTLIRLIAGMEMPSSGYIKKSSSVSWPIALSGGIQGSLTGLDNIRFLCRLYGKSYDEKRAQIEEFTKLGRYLKEPVSTYSSGMKTRLSLGVSMIIDFDFYLIDEALALGDFALQEEFKSELEKRKSKGLILVSHNERQIKDLCDFLVVLTEGNIIKFDNKEDALKFYKTLKNQSPLELSKSVNRRIIA